MVELDDTARFLLPATGETIEILPESRNEVQVIYREIFEDGVYSRHGVAVRPGDVVVDVGANIGMFCLHIAASTAGQSQPLKYYGIEALPPLFEILRRNVGATASGGGVSVQALLNAALGDGACADVAATLFPRLPGNSTLRPEERIRMQRGIVEPRFFEGARQYLVPMRTLSDVIDEYAIERVDFLKVDVEGAELMVLQGVNDAHWSRILQVVVEVPDVNEEINNDGTIVAMKRVDLITSLLSKHGFVTTVDCYPHGKNYMVYARHQ